MPLFEQHRPTVLILDIVLPVMDGVTAATILLKKHPDATVVMCSSISARDKIVACRDAGVAHFVLKPFTPEKLAAVARLLLDKAATAASTSEAVHRFARVARVPTSRTEAIAAAVARGSDKPARGADLATR